MKRPHGALAWAELAAALLITALIVALNLRFSTEAGALWRDEVSTVELATRPTYADVLRSLSLDSAPALYPTLLRLWSSPWTGEQDGPLRTFGFGVATAMLGAIWVTGRTLAAGPPLLALAVFAAHAGMLQTAGSVKPYGLGGLFIVLAFGAIGRLTAAPRRRALLYALTVAILAVQTLYHNAPLILAVCVAGFAVAAVARERSAALAVLATGVVAAVSLLPYVGVLLASRSWRPLNQSELGTRALLVRSSEMVTEGSWPLAALWAAAAVLVVYGVVRALRRSSSDDPASRTHVLYAALVIVAATSLHLGFLKLAGRVPQAWQFVPLIAVVALAIDVVLGGTRSLRWARVGTAVLATALAFPASLDRVGARQTNVDLIAQYVHTAAQPGDLILVNPWYVGITFNRYYRGPVRWMTLPPMEDLTVHRYDLLKLRMTSAEPLAPLYGAIQGALESRHRVWLVGGLLFPPAGYVPPVLPPAPGLPTGWSDGPYTIGWALQTGHFVQTHAERLAVVKIPVDRPVNGLENMGLLVVEGWRRPELQNGDSKTPALPYSPR
ncbi:MAG: hypothetical protein DMD93_16590 [Candidatus Rokuibacteriota bacterium]|nr:MAG: hypothetical protein DMD93_16590 [Candidatus Rokubacteria bacterium]